MIRPLLKDDALLTDIESADEDAEHFHLWWLGQSGFLIKWDGQHLLFDPYLSDSLTKKYAETDKPHVRMTELVVDPSKLDFIGVITSSHNHTDHLDAETVSVLGGANPGLKLVLPEANIDFARERLGDSAPELLGLDEGTEQAVGAFRFTGVAAAHNEIDRDAEGRCHYLGFLVEFGPWRVYHSGDTLWHDGLVPALAAESSRRSCSCRSTATSPSAAWRANLKRHRGRHPGTRLQRADGHPLPLRHVRVQHRDT